MPPKQDRSRRQRNAEIRRASQRASPGLLEQRSLELEQTTGLPAVFLRSASYHPLLFRKMLDRADRAAHPGDLVQVFDKRSEHFGFGLYNPRSEVVVRMLSYDESPPGEAFWAERLEQAARLRRQLLRLDRVTNAYRVLHSEADGLSGIVVDRLGDVLSAEVYSLGMFQRSRALLALMCRLVDVKHWIVQVPDSVHGQEGFLSEPLRSSEMPDRVTITENGTRYRVYFEGAHKTGFFCDQRENRLHLAEYCEDRSVLDVCCYTGGFAIQAKRLGQATDVTGVDLDEKAIRLARENANLNQLRIQFVHADAFAYMRDMLAGGRRFGVVILDPPKLIRSRRELEEGRRKHFDFNRLAMQLVEPGGLLLTCSCSGLLAESDFLDLVYAAARKAVIEDSTPSTNDSGALGGRRLQVLARTGAAPDHPVSPQCPETEYLKALWLRVL